MFSSLLSRTKHVSSSIKNYCLITRHCAGKPAESKPPGPEGYSGIHRRVHSPTPLEKKVLVWTGRFKSIDEIPATITIETLEKARNKFRIKMANYMMAATLVGCLIMVISGKRAVERGESISKMNLDWHKDYNKSEK